MTRALFLLFAVALAGCATPTPTGPTTHAQATEDASPSLPVPGALLVLFSPKANASFFLECPSACAETVSILVFDPNTTWREMVSLDSGDAIRVGIPSTGPRGEGRERVGWVLDPNNTRETAEIGKNLVLLAIATEPNPAPRLTWSNVTVASSVGGSAQLLWNGANGTTEGAAPFVGVSATTQSAAAFDSSNDTVLEYWGLSGTGDIDLRIQSETQTWAVHRARTSAGNVPLDGDNSTMNSNLGAILSRAHHWKVTLDQSLTVGPQPHFILLRADLRLPAGVNDSVF